jgi:hypothetical protein
VKVDAHPNLRHGTFQCTPNPLLPSLRPPELVSERYLDSVLRLR